MEAVLSGEMFDAFRDKNTGEPLNYNCLGISKGLQTKIEGWRDKYIVYISMKRDELSKHEEEVANLDKQAIALLEEASKEVFNNTSCITELSYFSLCKDSYLAKFSR